MIYNQATMAHLISLLLILFEKNKREKQDRKVSISVPSCKGNPLQGCGRPWYRGYGTAQEQRTLAI